MSQMEAVIHSTQLDMMKDNDESSEVKLNEDSQACLNSYWLQLLVICCLQRSEVPIDHKTMTR